jgi:hypothetical protein
VGNTDTIFWTIRVENDTTEESNGQALVENLAGNVHNPRKKSHLGSAEREERLSTAPHFLYHYEKKKKKESRRLQCVQQLEDQRSQERNVFLL